MCRLYSKFCENQLNRFCIILLTNLLTKASENNLLGGGDEVLQSKVRN